MTSSPLTSLSYSPKEPQVLAGGCYSGQVSWWDVRTGPQPVASVKFENSHTEPVYKTIWTASKSGSEIMTGGSDGLVRWWDIRNFEKAKEELIVDVENKDPKSSGINTCLTMDTLNIWIFLILGDMEKALTVSCLEYEPTIPAKFMIGTDQGVALGCSRKAKCQAEYILNTYQAHYGPIRALQRNPCYTKVNIFVFHIL